MCKNTSVNIHAKGYIVSKTDIVEYNAISKKKDINEEDIDECYDNFIKKIYKNT